MDIVGDIAGFEALEDLDGLARGIADNPAVGALAEMSFQLDADFASGLLVEIIGQLGEKFFTCKQRRRLPCV